MWTQSLFRNGCTFVLLAPAFFAATAGVSISLEPGSDAKKVSGSLISFSIEPDRWTDWVGTTSRNEFFYNILDNLRRITGDAPHVRIGGNTQDRTDFSEGVEKVEPIFPAPDNIKAYPEATELTVGQSYYAAIRFLPPGTRVTWGVNFGANNLSTTYLQARAIIKLFSSAEVKNAGVVLDHIEIGNEPDLYAPKGTRAKNYTVSSWVGEWLQFAQNISKLAGIDDGSKTQFLGASFAFSTRTEDGFSPQNAVESGLLKGPGKAISTISQHHYYGTFCTGKPGNLGALLDKSNIRKDLVQFKPDIEAMNAAGLDYILGETNSYSCHGAPEVSDTAGAALWALDYTLHATQLSISRVFFHNGVGFKYNLIQPVALTRSIRDGSKFDQPLPAHIQPQYYAAIIAAEAVGDSKTPQVKELDIDAANVSGYAFYEGGELARVVFINLNVYDPNGGRDSVHIKIDFKNGGKKRPLAMLVKRLLIKKPTDTAGLTWGGQTYETSDGRPSGTLTLEPKLVADGVEIRETEVVMVRFLPVYVP